MIRKILNKVGVLQLMRERKLNRRIDAERNREEEIVVNNLAPDKFTPITEEEKQQIINLWNGIDKLSNISLREYEMFKHIYGFDARFLTHGNYLPIIARLLNDYSYTKIFDDKGLLGYIKSSYIRFPKCYVRHIVSDYYDNNMRQLTFEEAIGICAKQEELFIKPSRETSGGKGATLLRLNSLSYVDRIKLIREELSRRTTGYVIQECIHQHPLMAQFNKSSVNTFRITTLMLNSRFSICSIVLRCGKDGSTVDNWGAGGLLINVTTNGKVNSRAHDIHLNEYESNGSCVFADCTIPQMSEILRVVEKCHSEDFAICKFIGWDITIDCDGNPVILELNSSQPGVIGEQLVAGPIFGDRTQEVIDYCKSKKFAY